MRLCAEINQNYIFAKAMPKEHYIIGISGGSGSGKTSFLNMLKSHFSEEQVCFISLDNYYLPREEQYTDPNGIQNFDLPQSIRSVELLSDIQNLKNDEVISRKEYVFNNEKAQSKTITIKPAPVMIIEGLFIYHYPELRSLFDLKLFVHAKDNLKLIRRIKRDRVERNYPLEDVIYRYEHHVMPAFEKYIEAYREDSDIIINNNKSFENSLEVIRAFIHSKLA